MIDAIAVLILRGVVAVITGFFTVLVILLLIDLAFGIMYIGSGLIKWLRGK